MMRKPPAILSVLLSAALFLPATAFAAGAQSADAQIDFGIDMAKRGLWNEALFRFQAAQQLEPGSFRVWNNLAVAYEATGQFEQALDAYQHALRMEPSNRELRRNYSRFIEFYQSFKPEAAPAEGAAEAAAGAAETAEAPAEPESAADGRPDPGGEAGGETG
jgi:Tfp pilus assembly protein PilF